MSSTEQDVTLDSDFYIHTPSAQASTMFLYPASTSYSRYLPGYCLRRFPYDSFLTACTQRGGCEAETGGRIYHAGPSRIVLLDCCEPHCYYTTTGQSAKWLHFNGSSTRSYSKAIMDSRSSVINLHDIYHFEKYLHKTCISFKDYISIKEALLNDHTVNILTELLIGHDIERSVNVSTNIIEGMVAYISEHLTDPLTLGELASQASLSPLYSSGLFKKETGFTPHGYVITTRVNNAKFLLESSDATIKEVCSGTGFTSESNFCITFKKVIGSTPSEYQERICQ